MLHHKQGRLGAMPAHSRTPSHTVQYSADVECTDWWVAGPRWAKSSWAPMGKDGHSWAKMGSTLGAHGRTILSVWPSSMGGHTYSLLFLFQVFFLCSVLDKNILIHISFAFHGNSSLSKMVSVIKIQGSPLQCSVAQWTGLPSCDKMKLGEMKKMWK